MAITANVASTAAAKNLGLTAFSKILKEYYLPATIDLLNSKRILSRFIGRNQEDVSGSQAVCSLNVGRNEGVGYVGEGGKLPDPGKQPYDQARYDMRYHYGRILVTGQAVSSSRNDRGAFLRRLDAEIKGLARDIQHEDNRVWFGNGTGRLCQITADGSAPSYSVGNPGGFANTGSGTQYLRKGMRVCTVTNEANGITAATLKDVGTGAFVATITAVDHVNGTITLSTGADSLTTGDYLYRASELALGSAETLSCARGYEPFGLRAIIDDDNPPLYDGGAGNRPAGVGEIDATAEDIWRAMVLDNGGIPTAFSQDMLQQLMDNVDIIGDGVISMFMTTHGIRRQYVNSLLQNKRYVGTMEMDGGWKAVTYDDRPMLVDKDCTSGYIYGLDLECLEIFMETDYAWMDSDGSVLHRLPNNDAYQATLYRYHQMGTRARNRLGVIRDIQDN